MFGISFPEFVIIFLIAFLIIGPKKMVENSYQLGVWIRKAKNQWEFIKETKLSGIDSSSLFDAKIELNKTIAELKNPESKNQG